MLISIITLYQAICKKINSIFNKLCKCMWCR